MSKNFFEIASAAESIGIELEMVQNLTTLFDEHLETELESLKSTPCMVNIFLDRTPMLSALLSAIECGLSDISRDLQALFDQAIESHKAHKGGAGQ